MLSNMKGWNVAAFCHVAMYGSADNGPIDDGTVVVGLGCLASRARHTSEMLVRRWRIRWWVFMVDQAGSRDIVVPVTGLDRSRGSGVTRSPESSTGVNSKAVSSTTDWSSLAATAARVQLVIVSVTVRSPYGEWYVCSSIDVSSGSSHDASWMDAASSSWGPMASGEGSNRVLGGWVCRQVSMPSSATRFTIALPQSLLWGHCVKFWIHTMYIVSVCETQATVTAISGRMQ